MLGLSLAISRTLKYILSPLYRILKFSLILYSINSDPLTTRKNLLYNIYYTLKRIELHSANFIYSQILNIT